MSDAHGKKGRERFDLSIMYSRECDLACPHCMYDCGPRVKDRLDLEKLRQFISTWDERVNSVGFYGGEATLHTRAYTKIAEMLPPHLQRWMITNGAWSTYPPLADAIIRWAQLNRVSPIIVSGTQYHRPHQHRRLLELLASKYPDNIWLKGEEDRYIPMGRLKNQPFHCTKRCETDDRPTRIAVQPDGSIIFQTCDGSYPVIGNMSYGFPAIAELASRYTTSQHCPFFRKSDGLYTLAQVED